MPTAEFELEEAAAEGSEKADAVGEPLNSGSYRRRDDAGGWWDRRANERTKA